MLSPHAKPAVPFGKVAVAITAALCVAWGSQPQDADELSHLSLAELLNHRVISSTQTETSLQDAPATIVSITADEIRRYGIRRLADLVGLLVPGAFTTEDGDDRALSFRGVASDNNSKVLLLLNSHYYNTQWTNGSSSEVLLGLMQDIDHVEVITGPGAALYGSGATIGVINIITKQAANVEGGNVTATIGAPGNADQLKSDGIVYQEANILAGGTFRDSGTAFFSIGGLSSKGYNDEYAHGEGVSPMINPSPKDGSYSRGELTVDRFPLNYRVFGEIGYGNFEIFTRLARASYDFHNTLYADPTKKPPYNIWQNHDTYFAEARYTWQPLDELKVVFAPSFDAVQTQRHDFSLGTLVRAVGEERYTAKATGHIGLIPRNNIVAGIEYRRDEFGGDWAGNNFHLSSSKLTLDTTETIKTTVLPDSSLHADTVRTYALRGIPTDQYSIRAITPYGRNVVGVFAQDQVALILDKLNLLVGFRLDYIDAPFFEDLDRKIGFTPRAALVYNPVADAVVKLMYTTGFRSPLAMLTSDDQFHLGGISNVEITKPEKMSSVELSGSWLVHKGVNIGLNTYYNSLKDLHGKSGSAFVSSGKVDFVGGEALLTVRGNDRFLGRLVHQVTMLGAARDDKLNVHVSPATYADTNYRSFEGVDGHIMIYPENVTRLLLDFTVTDWFSCNLLGYEVWGAYGYDKQPKPGQASASVYPAVKLDPYANLNVNLVFTLHRSHQIVVSGYNLLWNTKLSPRVQMPMTGSFATGGTDIVDQVERHVNLTYSFSF